MKLRYYSVKDVVVGSFQNALPLHNDAEARRAIKEAISMNNGNNEINQRAGDLQFWYLFTIDSDTGLIVDNNPSLIANIIDFVAPVTENKEN